VGSLIRFECVFPLWASGSIVSESPLQLKQFAVTTEFDDEFVQCASWSRARLPISSRFVLFVSVGNAILGPLRQDQGPGLDGAAGQALGGR